MFDLQTRRQFLNTAGMGLGGTVLGSILAQGKSDQRHSYLFQGLAKRVIFLFWLVPSQLDLFDPSRPSQTLQRAAP